MEGRDGSVSLARDAWAVLRVRQWIVFAPLPAAGVARLGELHGARALELAIATIAASLSLAYAYGINAIFDRRSDRDADKNVLAGRPRVPAAVIASVTGAGLLSLCAAGSLGASAAAALAVAITAGTAYSAGPRLKRFPILGLIGNLLIFAPLMLVAVRPATPPRGLWLLVSVFALLVTQNQLVHEEADAAEDEDAGALTTARWIGPRGVRASLLALAAGIGAAGLVAPTGVAAAICAAGGVASALVLLRAPAAARRRAHRYLAGIIGVALFLACLEQA